MKVINSDVFGEDVKVNVNIHEGKNASWWEFWNWDEKYVPITLANEKGVPHVVTTKKPNYGDLNMYYQDEIGSMPYSKDEFIATITHEFGHILGIKDAYGEDNRPDAYELGLYDEDGIMRYQFNGINI